MACPPSQAQPPPIPSPSQQPSIPVASSSTSSAQKSVMEFPKTVTVQLSSERSGGIRKGFLAKHKGKPPISVTFHFVKGKGKIVWQFTDNGMGSGKKHRITSRFGSIKALHLDRATWNMILEVRAPPVLTELVSEGKKMKWAKAKTDFTNGNSKSKRFHVAKAHALGLGKLGEAIAYFELFDGEKYGGVVKEELALPDIDPGFKLKGHAAKRKIPSTIPDFKPIEKKAKSDITS
eukprot:jgi/Bigna1/66378/fgenesh1_pg.1_\